MHLTQYLTGFWVQFTEIRLFVYLHISYTAHLKAGRFSNYENIFLKWKFYSSESWRFHSRCQRKQWLRESLSSLLIFIVMTRRDLRGKRWWWTISLYICYITKIIVMLNTRDTRTLHYYYNTKKIVACYVSTSRNIYFLLMTGQC